MFMLRAVKEPLKQSWREGGLILFLALCCAVVTMLQFRWTGELARVEAERLGGDQEEAARSFAAAFDRELERDCGALTPDAEDLEPAVVSRRIVQWQSGKPQPVFSRIALARQSGRGVALRLFDPATGESHEGDWPVEWKALRQNLGSKSGGAPEAPYTDATGLLLEFPLHRADGGPPPRSGRGPGGPPPEDDGRGEEPNGQGPEAGWMIFQLDAPYLAGTWLPKLAARFFNPPGREFYHVRVSLADGAPLFSAGGDKEEGVSASIRFNHRGREIGGSPIGGGVWKLDVRRDIGAVERAVAVSRRQNLGIAVLVNVLILASGVLLLRQTRRARRLAEERMAFVAAVSHELRTPLTVIRGAAHNLKRGIASGPEAVARYAGLILSHTDQLTEMVEQTLDFSAAGKGGPSGPLVPTTISTVIEDALADTVAETAGCTLEVSIATDLPLVKGDPAALRRALQNLITNAAKHGGRGWIGVTARAVGNRVEIAIADRGPGIPAAEQKEIFAPFYRGMEARAAQVRGSGLGLSLVAGIIRAHGGRISVSSAAGQGATFIILLPAMPSP